MIDRAEFAWYQPPRGELVPEFWLLNSNETWHDHVRGDGCCYAGTAHSTIYRIPGESEEELRARARAICDSLMP